LRPHWELDAVHGRPAEAEGWGDLGGDGGGEVEGRRRGQQRPACRLRATIAYGRRASTEVAKKVARKSNQQRTSAENRLEQRPAQFDLRPSRSKVKSATISAFMRDFERARQDSNL
jgi:hypothetical protein